MNRFYIALAVATLTPSFALPQNLTEISQFAQSICGDIPEGNLTRTSIQAKVGANTGRLAKIVSGKADISGSRFQEYYNGIPFDKLPDNIPTVSMCKSQLANVLISKADPPVHQKTPNNQYTVYLHQCKSANYSPSEFKNLKDAKSSIESALRTKGFSSVKMGNDQDKCDLLGLTVIASFEEDRVGAEEAASAIQAILNDKPPATVQINLKDKQHDLGVWFLMQSRN
jgi:hypothetical protein